MDVWVDEKKPEVFSTGNLVLAVLIHLVFFLGCYVFACFHFKPKETVVPIDLTVVINENLDGNENDPPPLDDPPPPPPPPPKVVTPPPPPPPVVDTKVPAVVTVKDKKKPPEKKPPEKTKKQLEEERLKKMRESAKEVKPTKKPPEKKPPEKTKEQLMKERMDAMRKSVANQKPVKIKVKDQPSGNGKTEKQTRSKEEIEKLLQSGYKAGATTQLAASEEQRCISLIRAAFYAKWDRPPWTADLREMQLKVKFAANGRVTGYQLVRSSGDAKADATVTRAAALVTQIVGLSESFLAKNRDGVIVQFKVTPQ